MTVRQQASNVAIADGTPHLHMWTDASFHYSSTRRSGAAVVWRTEHSEHDWWMYGYSIDPTLYQGARILELFAIERALELACTEFCRSGSHPEAEGYLEQRKPTIWTDCKTASTALTNLIQRPDRSLLRSDSGGRWKGLLPTMFAHSRTLAGHGIEVEIAWVPGH